MVKSGPSRADDLTYMKIALSISALVVALSLATAVSTKIVGHHTTCTTGGQNANQLSLYKTRVCKTSHGLW